MLSVLSEDADPASDAMTGVTDNMEITSESDNSQAKYFARFFSAPLTRRRLKHFIIS